MYVPKYHVVKLELGEKLLAVLPWEIGVIPTPLREFMDWKRLQKELGQFHVVNTREPDVYVISYAPFRAYYKREIGILMAESEEIMLDKTLSEFVKISLEKEEEEEVDLNEIFNE